MRTIPLLPFRGPWKTKKAHPTFETLAANYPTTPRANSRFLSLLSRTSPCSTCFSAFFWRPATVKKINLSIMGHLLSAGRQTQPSLVNQKRGTISHRPGLSGSPERERGVGQFFPNVAEATEKKAFSKIKEGVHFDLHCEVREAVTPVAVPLRLLGLNPARPPQFHLHLVNLGRSRRRRCCCRELKLP